MKEKSETPKAPTASELLENQLKETPKQAGNIFLSIFMAILGLVLIYLCDQRLVGSVILYIGALAFLIPGFVLLLSLIGRRKDPSSKSATVMNFLTGVCGVGAIAMGVVIFAIPDTFRPLLCYIFGVLLIICGAYQIDLMLRRNRSTLYPGWLILAPILLIVGGVVIMTAGYFKGVDNEKPMLFVTGIGFTLFGVIGLLISYYAVRRRHDTRKALRQVSETTPATSGDSSDKDAGKASAKHSDASDGSDSSDNAKHTPTSPVDAVKSTHAEKPASDKPSKE